MYVCYREIFVCRFHALCYQFINPRVDEILPQYVSLSWNLIKLKVNMKFALSTGMEGETVETP